MTPPTKQDLEALAVRVEAATGADRELDCRIWCAIDKHMNFDVARHVVPDFRDWQAPAYTASLDAAMELLDRYGVLLHLSDIGADGLPYARVGRPDLDNVPIFTGIASCIMTDTSPVAGIALALCAAALRARAAGEVGS